MREARHRVAAQEPAPKPKAYGPKSLVVTDGQVTIASITPDDNGFHLFDANGKLIGSYPSRAEAIAAIPPVRK